MLSPADPLKSDLLERLSPPAWAPGGARAHPLGTDTLGRDVLSRLVHGARVSLVVGFATVLIAGVVGVVLGVLGGYYGGWLDDVLMRVGDVQLAFPVLLLGVALLAVLGAGPRQPHPRARASAAGSPTRGSSGARRSRSSSATSSRPRARSAPATGT